mmetsp:Transcript_13492/g.26538  ORF Transcript_13492/g.26538 Transcript_13492/m.26538 type:complete len:274 (-) Transcript_13492:48-869(-)
MTDGESASANASLDPDLEVSLQQGRQLSPQDSRARRVTPQSSFATWTQASASHQELQHLVRARLFGNATVSTSTGSGPISATQWINLNDKLTSPRPPRFPELGVEYTFKPNVNSVNSKKMETTSPRWMSLSPSQKEMNDKAKKIADEAAKREEKEVSECTFRPAISASSERICKQRQNTLKRWNTPKHNDNELAGVSADTLDDAVGKGSLTAQCVNTSRAEVPFASRSGLQRYRSSPMEGSYADSAICGRSFALGTTDPVFQDLHKMLRSLKI